MYRRRTTGEHDAAHRSTRRGTCGDLRSSDRMGNDLGVHVRLTHATSDQLRILRAEIDDKNSFETSFEGSSDRISHAGQ
ncbi:unannotated protein [freshwater metagenome]|uniref:Unannotated protein n=1 Tax=freshwater metagenome TaxID=449393 RepID=A0A6J7KPB2_9ZZZZ